MNQNLTLASCQARLDEQDLTIGNSLFSRRWTMENGVPRAISLKDEKTGREWLQSSPQAAPLAPGGAPAGEARLAFSAAPLPQEAYVSPSQACTLQAAWPEESWNYTWRVFPGSAGMLTTLERIAPEGAAVSRGTEAEPDEKIATGVELSDQSRNDAGPLDDIYESFRFASTHLKLRAVEFADQTDMFNQLVFEREYLLQGNERRVRLRGNLFLFEDSLTGEGLIFLKHAPLPHERPADGRVGEAFDLDWDRGTANFRALGFTGSGKSYGLAIIAYQGGKPGASVALHQWQREFRGYATHLDGLLLSNTWGDRSQDSRINAAFIAEEIEAAAELGVDIVQIDDGWQKGLTANSVISGGVWESFWDSDERFWEVDAKLFPEGLEPLVKAAASHGMRLGLWFGPDSGHDFVNWERDADTILNFHRTFGINHFKFDGIEVRSKKGEANLHRELEKVRRESNGEIFIDLDITAETRPGYFGALGYGPLFVENRYTDWHNYWPHQTLRNFWQLAHWIDPLRMRMEFLNNTRNTAQYPHDPLAPGVYSPAYLFATTMFFNPLGWFEVSNLPDEYRRSVAEIVPVWKQHRENIFRGTIRPIGAAPDGTSWTGFASLDEARSGFYFVSFRELNQEEAHDFSVPLFSHDTAKVEVLAGSGSAQFYEGKLRVEIGAPLGFVFGRVRG